LPKLASFGYIFPWLVHVYVPWLHAVGLEITCIMLRIPQYRVMAVQPSRSSKVIDFATK